MTDSYKYVIVKLFDILCFFEWRGAMVKMLDEHKGIHS